MKKLTLVLSVTLLGFIAMSVVPENASAFDGFGFAKLRPVNNSGIRARAVLFQTSGGFIKVKAIAAGLEMDDNRYVSLAYPTDNCGPGNPMSPFVGFWDVKWDGHAALSALTVAPLDLSAVNSMSIRDTFICTDAQDCQSQGLDNLVACGKVR